VNLEKEIIALANVPAGYECVKVEDAKIIDAVKECIDDTFQCPTCGHAEPWWRESNADYASRPEPEKATP
jgi:hypothetical protein